MNGIILGISLIYALIPILIIFRIFKVVEKKIRFCRFLYAIPAILLTIVNVSIFVYHYFIAEFTLFDGNSYAFLIPALALLLVLIVYNSGRRQEKILRTELAGQEIENVRFRKGDSLRNQLVITSSESDEIEKL